jgi:hypothetical protein
MVQIPVCMETGTQIKRTLSFDQIEILYLLNCTQNFFIPHHLMWILGPSSQIF